MKLQAAFWTIAALVVSHLWAGDRKVGDCGTTVSLRVVDGRPIANCVFVNGRGPFRFLVDTGTNVNLMEAGVARSIGLKPAFQVELASSVGSTRIGGLDGVEIAVGTARADRQKLLLGGMEEIRRSLPDVQGVLGQFFLARFDYRLDLRAKRLDFGPQDRNGKQVKFDWRNGRPVIQTSLGRLVLDSGTRRVILFGVGAMAAKQTLRTVAGWREAGTVLAKPLRIGERSFGGGDAVAVLHPSRSEGEVNGLLPLSLFQAVYVCNSSGFVIFD